MKCKYFFRKILYFPLFGDSHNRHALSGRAPDNLTDSSIPGRPSWPESVSDTSLSLHNNKNGLGQNLQIHLQTPVINILIVKL